MASSITPFSLNSLTQPTEERIDPTSLKSYGVKYIRVEWVGIGNQLRQRVVSLANFNKLMKTGKPCISTPQCALGLVFLTIPTEFTAIGECIYVLDLNSVRILPWAKGHAMVFGWFREKVKIERPLHEDTFAAYDPRTILHRLVRTATEVHSVNYLVGFESEFVLLHDVSPLKPVKYQGWSESGALRAGTVGDKVLEEIADSLQAMGIELQMYHAEAAPGQYEVVTGPLPPLEAADALIYTRETIYNVASKHGLRATFAPRLFNNSCGSAAHAHISVQSISPQSTEYHGIGDDFLSLTESQLLAGLLQHLPSLIYLMCPTSASYSRMIDGVWSGGTYVSWGRDNKEAPIRVCNAHSEISRNFEFKSIDATANPYVVLSGVLAAASLGFSQKMNLDVQECGGDDMRPAAELSEAERRERKVHARLPLDLAAAKKEFMDDKGIMSVLGEEFYKKYISVNDALHGCLTNGLDAQQQEKLLIETF